MTDVSAGFRPPCWCPSRWAPAWRLHTNLYKFGKNVSPHIFRKKNCSDLNLGESLWISTFFLFPDSRLNRLNGFYFLFWSINIPTITSNKHALYGVNGGTPLRNRRDRRTSIAWPNAKLISPVVDSALGRTSQRGQKLTRPKSLTLNGTTSWPPVSIVLECRQF